MMKSFSLLFLLKLTLLIFPAFGSIVVDQFGYQLNDQKVAIIKVAKIGQDAGQYSTPPGSTFYVRNLDTDEIIFEGTVVPWGSGAVHEQSGDQVWHLDFSELTDPVPSIREEILQRFSSKPRPFYGNAVNTDPYYAGMPDSQYHWGSLVVMSNTGILNLNIARYLDEPSESDYVQRARDILHYIHGKNPLDKSYLSNMYAYGAENPVNEFYHGWFEHGSPWQNVLFSEKGGPPPGYLVGGPNRAFSGDVNPYMELDQPPQKMYADFNDTGTWLVQYKSWEITENSIGYQAGYIRLLSEFINLSSDTLRYSAEVPEPSDNGPDNGETPVSFELHPNYPNPFNPSTMIVFSISRTSTVSIGVYTMTGQKVTTIFNETRIPGHYSVIFNASGLASGMYIYRMNAGDFSQSRKMVFLK